MMTFNLDFPARNGENFPLQLKLGETLFVLGANGAGKSSLMFRFAKQNLGFVSKISAHRQTWMSTDTLDMTPLTKIQTEAHIRNEDQQLYSRYQDPYASQRASMTIYDLINAENVRARKISSAVDSGDIEKACKEAETEAPITVINELLEQSNIPVTISIHENERVMASKENGPEYSAAELSDGERNALLIAGNVLTAKPHTLLVIDEPERHLHRSIISPLLSQLFERRTDCGFVISTHAHDLPLEVPSARMLLLRSCSFNDNDAIGWEANELPTDSPIDDVLKRDLLGARRKILFVEGTESSLDKSLYRLIFPMASVIPKGNCREVEQAVVGSRSSESLHWLSAFGIVDRDGYEPDQIEKKREKGIYVLSVYSVEAIYFHPRIIKWVAEIQADVIGHDATELKENALKAGFAAVTNNLEQLSQKAVEKLVRARIEGQIPNYKNIMNNSDRDIIIKHDASTIRDIRKKELEAAIADKNWQGILAKCPVQKSKALGDISSALGFKHKEHYESAVRKLLTHNQDALDLVRELFGDLPDQLAKPASPSPT